MSSKYQNIFEVHGINEVIKMLDDVEKKIGRKVLSKATREGAKITQKACKADAPRASGNLAKAIRVRSMKRKKGRIGMRVTMGAGNFTGDQYYGSFQEWGWKAGSRKSEKRKQIEGKHFMQHAAERVEESVKSKMSEVILRELDAICKG